MKLVLAVGDCDDGTVKALEQLDTNKLKVLHTVWDPAVRSGGLIISQQTNLALDACSGDWCFYLQADEVLHENELERIEKSIRRADAQADVDGLTFRYHHFRADYFYRDPLPYRRQTRIIRRSFGSAILWRRLWIQGARAQDEDASHRGMGLSLWSRQTASSYVGQVGLLLLPLRWPTSATWIGGNL